MRMASKNRKLPIIIVGAGIGGMTMALALAKKGIASIVLEQAPELRVSGAGIQFCPNTYKALNYLGLEEAFKDISFFPESHCYKNGVTGLQYLKIPLGKKILARFNHPFGGLHRQEVLRVFATECQNSSLITIHANSKVVEVGESGDSVYAKTENDTLYTGEALIGSDGIRSVVQRFVVGQDLPFNFGNIVYRGVVKRKDMPKGINLDDIVHFVLPGSYVVYYPIGTDDHIHISAHFEVVGLIPDLREGKGNPDELYHAYEKGLPIVKELVKYVDTSSMRLILDREPIQKWSHGRIALLGDAIHPTHPTLGSGAGMAIEDAVVLANKIEESKGDYLTAFKAYYKERHMRTDYVQRMSRFYNSMHYASGVALEAREFLLSKLSDEDIYSWYSFLYNGI